MIGYQIPRNSLAWMLAAQVAVIAPHVGRLPIWITLLAFGCGFWRIMVYQGRWSYPRTWTKVLFIMVGLTGVPIGYQKLYGLEPAIALLIVAFVLKLLEMHRQKDAYTVILLAYFVAITQFLFVQTIPWTIYLLVAVTMITAALIGLNQTKSHVNPMKTFRTAIVLLVQSLPLTIVLFVLYPRIGPLWEVPAANTRAVSGVSDSMSPGDIAELTQSDALVFQAAFEATPPPTGGLYWRGLVLSEFDGKTWSQDPQIWGSIWRYQQKQPGWTGSIEFQGGVEQYEVILEPTQQNWLFSLAVPQIPENRDLVMLRDYRLVSRHKVSQRLRYRVKSHTKFIVGRELAEEAMYTRIPSFSNPQTRALAERMVMEAGSDVEFINRVLRMYNREGFVYTLKPPTLGANGIDEFIFESRRGFCEHYAGSFVFMMRAAGIPARVVLGYLGGEYNPRDNYITVRQFDAHAWTEVWLEGRGWIRFDPTSAVSPDRIELGLDIAMRDENTFLEGSWSIFRLRQTLWLTKIRLQIDAVGHYWDTWVVGYSPEIQMRVLREFFGDISSQKLGLIMLTTFFSLLGVLGLFLLTKRSNTPLRPVDAEYLGFCRFMEAIGYGRNNGEGPIDYAGRIGKLLPGYRESIDRITNAYVHVNYIGNDSEFRTLKKAVRTLRFKILTTK